MRRSDPAPPWRSLEEPQLPRPSPAQDVAFASTVDRRQFLGLLGASLGLATMSSACTRQPAEKLVPYVRMPEERVPGNPEYFASSVTLGGYAHGVLVESHEGRPTKLEGNPEHPASLGATDLFDQASVLGLYDPDRSRAVTLRGEIRSWAAFVAALSLAVEAARTQSGAGLRILTETVTSPTLARLLAELAAALPEARWHVWEPVCRDAARAGAISAYGRAVDTVLRLDRADVVLSLEDDLFGAGPAALRHTRDFAARRGGAALDAHAAGEPIRLYCAESSPSLTGARADHRLVRSSAGVGRLAREVATALGVLPAGGELSAEARAIASDLERHRGRSLVTAGITQTASVHALAHACNQRLGNVGQTVVHIEPVEARPVPHLDSLRELVADMAAGRVQTLVVLGGNPVLTAPADLGFARALTAVPLRAHLSDRDDETSHLCQWHAPAAHELEAWGDARAFDGTASILQPLILPLYGGHTATEVLATILGSAEVTAEALVRATWKAHFEARHPGADPERAWRTALHDGFVEGTAHPPTEVTLRPDLALGAPADEPGERDLEVHFRPDPNVHDGRFANNGWLQELPRALTKLSWDNAVLLSPATAARLGLADQDVVSLKVGAREVRGPVFRMPGHAPDAVTVHFGMGRSRAGSVGTGVGFDAYRVRTSGALWSARGARLSKTGETYPLATTQGHDSMEGRALVRRAPIEQLRREPELVREMGEEPPRSLSLYPPVRYDGHAWGMTIDLDACTGCNACTIACQAENNIPVVGKDQVLRGREMHWIRVDRYYAGDAAAPETLHQPVLCQQCENAPCEVVCPTAATVHSAEGLNDMVYNRCVGTRYCSNNCPYKVRRFNFYLYSDLDTPSIALQKNPDVTVRTRGVMEKCTYCVQRIHQARIAAEREARDLRDGEIVTACEQACPGKAITFGDTADPASRVARAKRSTRNYGLLADLGTRPRTSYLASVQNPNPDLEGTRHE